MITDAELFSDALDRLATSLETFAGAHGLDRVVCGIHGPFVEIQYLTRSFRLPAGVLGPKVLLINELAGSGGDYFPWVFRQQKAGPLIGARTWGGLVKSSVHYSLVDGGALTAPDNAVFDPINNEWIGENKGIPPDIEVPQDAKTVGEGRDPQLERGVEEALRMLAEQGTPTVTPPEYSRPAAKPEQD